MLLNKQNYCIPEKIVIYQKIILLNKKIFYLLNKNIAYQTNIVFYDLIYYLINNNKQITFNTKINRHLSFVKSHHSVWWQFI